MTDTPPVSLTFTGDQHAELREHLFPHDGKEAVALALCGRRAGARRHRLVVREAHVVPYDACSHRSETAVIWQPDAIADLLEKATEHGYSVIKIHSHPNGYAGFSPTDDDGDEHLLPMIRGWVEADVFHGSAVMLPDGQMFGRYLDRDDRLNPIQLINVIGDDLLFWYADAGSADMPDFAASHAQAFDEGTIERLQRLSVAVIGCSGTGSPTIEQLVRLGVGEIVNVDDDHMEERNVNRIVNSTMEDARDLRPKVEVMENAIERVGLGTRVVSIKENLWSPNVVREVAECDIVIGCMDTIDGRYLLNMLATHYNQAYFDVGVRLVADESEGADAGVREVCGTVHYLQPGKSSLLSRGLFNMDDVAAAGLRRNDPEAHARQAEDGYISGVEGNRPAVISVNMFASSLAVNELLARIHPYREEPNSEHASVTFSLASMELISDPEDGHCKQIGSHVGKGDTRPLLGQMELAEKPS